MHWEKSNYRFLLPLSCLDSYLVHQYYIVDTSYIYIYSSSGTLKGSLIQKKGAQKLQQICFCISSALKLVVLEMKNLPISLKIIQCYQVNTTRLHTLFCVSSTELLTKGHVFARNDLKLFLQWCAIAANLSKKDTASPVKVMYCILY